MHTHTHRDDPKRVRFYRFFAALLLFYFLTLPVTTAIAIAVLSAVSRLLSAVCCLLSPVSSLPPAVCCLLSA
jgi:hypothetical protein